MNRGLKALAEHALLRGGPAWLARRRHRDRDLILAYHNIVPTGEQGGADASLHLPQARFAEQLDVISRSCEVVPLADLLGGAARHGRSRVAITFDDGYLGALTAGTAELSRRGLPATFFIAPGRLGGQTFWWDAYTEPDGRPISAAHRTYLLDSLAGDEPAIGQWAGTRLRPVPVPLAARSADEARVLAVAAMPGATVGPHSWSHPNLAQLPEARLHHELFAPLAWLAERLGRVEQACAFPYGRYSEVVLSALRQGGGGPGLAIEGGWVPAGEGPRQVYPRYNVPAGLSTAGFSLRLAGLLANA